MADPSSLPRRIWKSAQLYIGFHQDKQGRQRAEAHVWKPDNGNATINPDPAKQEAFLVLNATDPDATGDVQVKLRPDAIVLRRDSDQGWKGIKIDEGDVTVLVNGIEIRIGADGAITRTDEDSTTWVEADGYILRKTEFVEASMSADGENLTRRTEDHIAAISGDGVISKAK